MGTSALKSCKQKKKDSDSPGPGFLSIVIEDIERKHENEPKPNDKILRLLTYDAH